MSWYRTIERKLKVDRMKLMSVITVTSHEPHIVSNYRQIDGLFNIFLKFNNNNNISASLGEFTDDAVLQV